MVQVERAVRPNLDTLPLNLHFGECMRELLEDLRPVETMWPYFWLKAVAVRDGDIWRLCYCSFSGRWSDITPPGVIEVHEQSETLLAISCLIDAATAWRHLESLAEYTLTIAPEVTARMLGNEPDAQEERDSTRSSFAAWAPPTG